MKNSDKDQLKTSNGQPMEDHEDAWADSGSSPPLAQRQKTYHAGLPQLKPEPQPMEDHEDAWADSGSSPPVAQCQKTYHAGLPQPKREPQDAWQDSGTSPTFQKPLPQVVHELTTGSKKSNSKKSLIRNLSEGSHDVTESTHSFRHLSCAKTDAQNDLADTGLRGEDSRVVVLDQIRKSKSRGKGHDGPDSPATSATQKKRGRPKKEFKIVGKVIWSNNCSPDKDHPLHGLTAEEIRNRLVDAFARTLVEVMARRDSVVVENNDRVAA